MSRVEIALTQEELAVAAGLTPAQVERLVLAGLIEPSAPGASAFSAATAARLRRMLRLRRDLRVGLGGAAIIVDLVERIEALQRELDDRGREGRETWIRTG